MHKILMTSLSVVQFSRLCSSYCLVQAVAAAAALVLAGLV